MAEIKRLETLIKSKARIDESATLLMSMPGVAELTALTIVAEVGDFERFKTPEQLASYGISLILTFFWWQSYSLVT